MNISPINNNQPQFKARLPKTEINTLVDSALSHDKNAGIPKLYTLLEGLDNMTGEKAELKTLARNSQSSVLGFGLDSFKSNHCQLRIDDELVAEGPNIYDTLYSAVTSAQTKDGKKIPMPGAVFDIMWWKNCQKTIEDVKKLLN